MTVKQFTEAKPHVEEIERAQAELKRVDDVLEKGDWIRGFSHMPSIDGMYSSPRDKYESSHYKCDSNTSESSRIREMWRNVYRTTFVQMKINLERHISQQETYLSAVGAQTDEQIAAGITDFGKRFEAAARFDSSEISPARAVVAASQSIRDMSKQALADTITTVMKVKKLKNKKRNAKSKTSARKK